MKTAVIHRLDDTYIQNAWKHAETEEIEDLAAELLGKAQEGQGIDDDLFCILAFRCGFKTAVGQQRRIFLAHQRQQISARTILPANTGRVTRILSLLLAFYQRVRDRDHLAALDLSARNDLRQHRIDEETRKRFWQS